MIHKPKLASAIHNIAVEFTSFSPTIRLAKRWLSCHLFSGLIPEEAVELMVAYLFVSPQPYDAPTSPVVGLLRYFFV